MNSPSEITVIVITYNSEKYVEQTLDSIVSQKLNVPFMVFISDDCSSDNTQDIILAYKKNPINNSNPL